MKITRSMTAVVSVTILAATVSACGSDSGNSTASSATSSPSTVTNASSSTSTPSSSSARSSASGSSSAAGSSAATQRSSAASTTTATPGAKPAPTTAKPAGALNTAIRRHSFADATFVTSMAGTVTLHDGMSGNPSDLMSYSIGLPGTANGLGTGRQPVTAYGDVNGDGIEDAIVELDITQGQGVSIEYSVWEGTPSGGAKQLGKPFLTYGRCGIVAKSMTIGTDGIIHVTGNGLGGPCAAAGEGAPFTATYRVTNGAVVAIKPAPAI